MLNKLNKIFSDFEPWELAGLSILLGTVIGLGVSHTFSFPIIKRCRDVLQQCMEMCP